MMRKSRAILLSSVLMFAAGPWTAALAADEGDGSNWGRITEVYVDAAGTILRVQFSRDVINPGKCEGGDFYVRELDDSPASDRFLKALLAAHLADRKVKFWIHGCSKARWWGKTRPQIFDIYIG